MSEKPWASGPREIVEHGVALLQTDSDANRRIAFLSIDNAVELIAKTFLGLPKTISKISITRAQQEECAGSFPKLFETLDRVAGDRMAGINVGVIEWYHRLRNQLYHNGNGLTVEREKVETYTGIAIRLYETLFEDKLNLKKADRAELIANYLGAIDRLQRILNRWFNEFDGSVMANVRTPLQLAKKKVIDRETAIRIKELRDLGENLIHGDINDPSPDLSEDHFLLAQRLAETLENRLKDRGSRDSRPSSR